MSMIFSMGDTFTIGASAVTAREALTGTSNGCAVFNASSSALCHYAFGDVTVTAATTDPFIAPSSMQLIPVPKGSTHLAVIMSAAGNVTITAFPAEEGSR